ncbi:MAG: protein-methionine-sulfoxide reductase heme-binding subunit MsrQ [Gemmatimonadales bacterium]|jgi:sulfoxide reductase heme-binding subunit YedZ
MGARERKRLIERAFRTAVFLLALTPFALLVRDSLTGGLGTNPIEALTHRTGWWALTFLMLTLSVTPIRRIVAWGPLIKLRRTFGLFAFFYATLHFGVYIGLDQFFAFGYIWEDIAERPYITVGFTALLLLVPLAATSTKRMVKRLGGRRWNRLHKLAYVAPVLGVLHFLWLVKADAREPLIFAAILAVLLGYRAVAAVLRRAKAHRKRAAAREVSIDSAAPATQHAGGR